MAANGEPDCLDSEEDSPPGTPKPTLSDQIINRYLKSKFDPEDKMFLPEGCIKELVTLEAIGKELLDEKDQSEPKKNVVDFIYDKAKKVFAISVISHLRGKDLRRAIQAFKRNNFTDESLPVTKEYMTQHFGGSSTWSLLRIHTFCREQWSFLAPVFSQQNFKVNLEPDHILPFTVKSDLVKEGAFGQVFQVEIHPAHQKDSIFNVRQPSKSSYGLYNL